MSAVHEQPPSPDAGRNAIIERSPMLKSMLMTGDILDTVRMQSRGDILAAIHAKYGKQASDEMIEDSLAVSIASAANLFAVTGMVDKTRLAEDEETIKASDAIAEALFTIGFEIGNIDDAILFIPELTQFVQTYDADRNGIFFTDQTRQALQDPAVQGFLASTVIYPALGYGVLKRQLMTKGDSSKAISSSGRKKDSGKPDFSLYRRTFTGSPLNFDPAQPDIPLDIRDAFADDSTDSLSVPPPPDLFGAMREYINNMEFTLDGDNPQQSDKN